MLSKGGKVLYLSIGMFSLSLLRLACLIRESSKAVILRKSLVLQKLLVFGSYKGLSLSVDLLKCLSCTAFSMSELPFGSNAASEEELLPSEGCLSVQSMILR
ncbi:hypothetical protein E3N88_42486 [Mikania micrantha]|uniref:Uncharacterized protein n=1 Tax=Mikania micrantha TaxID=192012 RepID=A0A5N6LHR3_9ASTR|nr:hypothetical protein E3N88_42486 [Mikania micrantha]